MALAIFVVCGWLLCVCLHEFAHAFVAYLGGDESVKSKGYLTLNLARYIDPSLSLIFPALIMAMGGIGLPGAAVYINESKLRGRGWRSAVAAAGPAMSFFITYLLALPIAMHLLPRSSWVAQGMAVIVLFNVATTILNLLPIPPLDGYGIIRPWLPASVQEKINNISGVGALIMVYMLFAFVPGVSDTLWGVSEMITQMLGVPLRVALRGYREFRDSSGVVVVLMLVGLVIMSRMKRPGMDSASDVDAAATAQSSEGASPDLSQAGVVDHSDKAKPAN